MKNKQNHIYGIIGMVALFLVGGMLGYIANGITRPNKSVMTEQQCIELSGKISKALSWGKYDELERLNKIFSENCNDRNFDVPEQKAEEEKLPSITCEAVETLLLKRLNDFDEDDTFSEPHIERAKIYANLSERGCAKNTNVYKDLAKKEIDIARALNDDSLENEQEATEMVETYKRLQMQAEAEKMLEKAKKLTNPAIDFIIQLEKIIEE
ncbi:MAG: hypothetical protein IJL23_01785 [Alphaproteobacteria bacterium]|nr:hypothetical protein [Alphaproteobacteria bacterium]